MLEIKDKDDDEEEEDSLLGEVAWNLAKEMASSSGKKRQSGELTKSSGTSTVVARKTYAAPATALRPSSYVPHDYIHPRVIIEGLARLEVDDKVKEFLDLVVTLISNGKIVDCSSDHGLGEEGFEEYDGCAYEYDDIGWVYQDLREEFEGV